MIRIEVQKNSHETTGSMVRRFTKKVQASGILKQAKSLRYHSRERSDYFKKKSALKRLKKKERARRLWKLGKIPHGFRK